MRYWSWLGAKLMAGAALLGGGLWAVRRWSQPGGVLAGWPQLNRRLGWPGLESHAFFTWAVGLAAAAGFALGWLCAIDQIYRCRTCARRLRMPLSAGNYGHTMLGPTPYTEYICTHGHGKLYVPDLHLPTARARRWIGYGSLWENLLRADRHGGE